MKKFLFILPLYLLCVHADNSILKNTNEKGCTIPFFKEEAKPCSSEISPKKSIKIKPISISTTKIPPEKIVQDILKNVSNYKKNNENKTKQLLKELENLKKEFKQFKTKTNDKISKVNTQLNATKKKLSTQSQELVKTEKKVKSVYKQLKLTKKELSKEKVKVTKLYPKKPKVKSLEKRITKKKIAKIIQPQIIHQPIIMMSNLPWVEIIVEDGINLQQLALKYYGNSDEYLNIYAANQDVIGKNFKITDGMSLKIPIIGNFEEQPMVLNTY